jgi:hypothetical protein
VKQGRAVCQLVPAEGRPQLLHAARWLRGATVAATNGDIGTVDDLFFDDWSWTIRYLVVDTRGWLSGRRVLISPLSATTPEWRRLSLALTREQVAESPQVDCSLPISRQQETELTGHYGHPCYWVGPYRWGPIPWPGLATAPPLPTGAVDAEIHAPGRETANPRLHSIRGVTGSCVAAMDGPLGHVEDLLVDGRTWAIRYVLVDTRGWWPGKKVLVAPDWISTVSWPESRLFIDLSRDRIRRTPEYDATRPLDRDFEKRLYDHYRRPPYWEDEERMLPTSSGGGTGTEAPNHPADGE